jgi:hypothetical protein
MEFTTARWEARAAAHYSGEQVRGVGPCADDDEVPMVRESR